MKLLLLLFTFSASHLALAEPRVKKPFLYMLEKDGKTSYLLGTMHVGVSLTEFHKCVISAVMSSNSFICEITENFNDLDSKKKEDLLFNYKGPGLYNRLSAEAWRSLLARLGPMATKPDRVDHLRPGAALFLLRVRSHRKAAAEAGNASVDHDLISYAGERIQGLETYADRILPVTVSELEGFLTSKKKAVSGITVQELTEIYLQGAIEPFWERYLKFAREDAEAFNRAVIQTNLQWMPKIARIHSSGGKHFFFVGLAHLPGKDGVLKLARSHGFDVSRIDACGKAIKENL